VLSSSSRNCPDQITTPTCTLALKTSQTTHPLEYPGISTPLSDEGHTVSAFLTVIQVPFFYEE